MTLDPGSVYTACWALPTPGTYMALQPLVLLGLIRALLSLVSQCTASMGAMVVAWGAEVSLGREG